MATHMGTERVLRAMGRDKEYGPRARFLDTGWKYRQGAAAPTPALESAPLPAAPEGGVPGMLPPMVPQMEAPRMGPRAAGVPAAGNMDAPRLFVDSDGRARAGYNFGGALESEAGIVRAGPDGVPVGTEMVPVAGLSQGSASVGMPAEFAGPVGMRPRTPDGREIDARPYYGGDVPVPAEMMRSGMNDLRGAAMMAELDATRGLRWNQSGPTSAVNRRVEGDRLERRQQSQAMAALERRQQMEAEQARLERQNKVDVATASNPPRVEKPMDVTEQVRNVATALKAVSGADIDPMTLMQIQTTQDPAVRQQLLDAATRGNPQVAGMLERLMTGLLGGQAPAAAGKKIRTY